VKREIDIQEAISIIDNSLNKQGRVIQRNRVLKVAILGHPYVIYDEYISLNILKKLRKWGIEFVVAENLPSRLKRDFCLQVNLPQEMYWTAGEELMGAAMFYSLEEDIDGIIYISAFGCGLDSIIEELISLEIISRCNKPYMWLLLDEHTSEVSFLTRLSAFFDTIKLKNGGRFLEEYK